ncbi:TPA: DUF968 domain-containing protein [Acinetobacter nosocomialis]|nr:DUF968 domain-containing protein [Acinetobacter nosocomialis]HEM8428643.1 DUF968 domain-containing protein [Acinetobacter nosocomialis]
MNQNCLLNFYQKNIRDQMRDAKRLAAIRRLPCVRCGYPHSQAAHSNSGKHGKGKGIKASDAFTVPLCHKCHFLFDTYQLGTRQESETMFERWLEKTELMLKIDTKSDDVF